MAHLNIWDPLQTTSEPCCWLMVPNVTQKWPEKPIRCMNMLHTTAVSLRRQSTGEMRRSVAILEPLMLHGLLLRTSSPSHWVQKAKIFSCMSMDTVASRKNYLDAERPALTKDEKGSCTFCQKPTRNANLAKFACPNLAKCCLSNCVFRCSENNIFFENVHFVSAVSGPPGSSCFAKQI